MEYTLQSQYNMQMVYNSVNVWWGAGEKHDKNLLVTVYFDYLSVVHLMAIFSNRVHHIK
jgi:hypothetical protein